MGIDAENGPQLSANVPDADCLVNGARGQDIGFVGRPLNVFDRIRVTARADADLPAVLCWVPNSELAAAIARGQAPRCNGRPVHGIAFGRELVLENLLAVGRARRVLFDLLQLLRQVVDSDGPLVTPDSHDIACMAADLYMTMGKKSEEVSQKPPVTVCQGRA